MPRKTQAATRSSRCNAGGAVVAEIEAEFQENLVDLVA
jgi:hypothetical protein